MEFLIKLWNEVVRRAEGGRCPALIYNDLDLLLRTVRDLFTADVEKLIIDSRPRVRAGARSSSRRSCRTSPATSSSTTAREPIFDGFGIEIEIDRALERKVWLKSGGYLIVDEMEALTAIDVNTGRFVGKSSLEDTITKTNLEACREVADQLRIRSIGGMIVVDFIDMDRPHNREKVTRAFNDYLRKDRAKAAVTRISELGLVEMTRKRTRESLLHTLTEPCPPARARATRSRGARSRYELFRELRRQGDLVEGDTVLVEVHPEVAQVLATTDRPFLEEHGEALAEAHHRQGARLVPRGGLRDPVARATRRPRAVRGGRRRARGEKGGRESKRRRRRRRGLGSPAEVEAALAEDEAASVVDPELLAGEPRPRGGRRRSNRERRRRAPKRAIATSSRPTRRCRRRTTGWRRKPPGE